MPNYSWLTLSNSVEEYIEPSYYERILKTYTFRGKTDLEYFAESLPRRTLNNALEIGSGSGRATRIFRKAYPETALTMVDLSERMIDYVNQAHGLATHSTFVVSDALEFISNTSETFDYVYSLWSFSHSVHQHFHRLGHLNARAFLHQTIKKLVSTNLIPGGTAFIIHFDSLSQEQRILMRQWRRVYPTTFHNIKRQSPSKQSLDGVLLALKNEGLARYSCRHLVGDPIRYESLEDLLEVFMNFHLETYFNDHPLTDRVMHDIVDQATPYRQENGTYLIRPGCFLYRLTTGTG